MKNTQIKRGQIYYCNIPKTAGSVYHSRRPVLVISNNRKNFFSRSNTGIPLTSKLGKNSLPTHVPIHTDCGMRRESIAMCENVCNYSKESLSDFICEIDENSEVMKQIEKALLIQVGMA